MKLKELYFKWLIKKINVRNKNKYFNNLLSYLYNVEFTWTMARDENLVLRAYEETRPQFFDENPIARKYLQMGEELEEPCSVLEMMVGLALDCETKIMTNFVDDNTGEWFWAMVDSLGLDEFDDGRWDLWEVDLIVNKFLKREYEPDGKGGLFTVSGTKTNMQKLEIWYQMQLYLRFLNGVL